MRTQIQCFQAGRCCIRHIFQLHGTTPNTPLYQKPFLTSHILPFQLLPSVSPIPSSTMSTNGELKSLTIPQRRLGGSGLWVSELGLGTLTLSTDGKSAPHPISLHATPSVAVTASHSSSTHPSHLSLPFPCPFPPSLCSQG